MNVLNNLENLEELLFSSIKGQDHVVPRVVKVLQRGELNLTNPNRPKGNFLFLGPTGTGKTEITKAFTKALFEDEKKLIRFDMSEYQTKESLESLIGDKSGWNGRLGEAIIKSEGSGTLLFDEMEKASREVLDIFLQMMDDARITTGTGLTHCLSGFYIVMTSNVGADKLINSRRLNFATIEKSIKASLSQYNLRDEFLARFNEVLVFKVLDYDTLREIAILILDQELKRMCALLSKEYSRKMVLVKSLELIDWVIMEGTNSALGARPLRNYIETAIQNAVAQRVLSGKKPEGLLAVEHSGVVIITPK